MSKYINKLYKSRRDWKRYKKEFLRRERFRRRKAGYQLHLLVMKKRAIEEGRLPLYEPPRKNIFAHPKQLPPKPEYLPYTKYLLSFSELFSTERHKFKENGHLLIPECFSLTEKYEESFDFLKRFINVLHKQKVTGIILDYHQCKRIDIDASICMDIILAEFIAYIKRCKNLGYKDVFPGGIIPKNYIRPNILKVLCSIGAFRNIKGIEIKFPDVEPLPVLINNRNDPNVWHNSELHQTNIVEYIKRCLLRLGRELSTESETSFYKVIGEILSNAEEHGTMPDRFALGFFQEDTNEEGKIGVFNFSIINFGASIYQTFKNEKCENKKAVGQMKQLSEDFTRKGWFKSAIFEEETLWTLYALQEGVTCREKKRGNGSIQYIENFFKLKGDMIKDDFSTLTIVSGNTRIVFDGTYPITNKQKEGEKRIYKMVTFNKTGEITVIPDKKYVTFAPHFFPGTMVSARILIKQNNTNEQTNGQDTI